MRVLILAGGGMLGHKLAQLYRDRFETWVTVRGRCRDYVDFGLFDRQRMIEGVDASHFDTVVDAMATVRPGVVINCIGIIKQLAAAKKPIISLSINSLFPHRMAKLCEASGARFIHISTDCVFNGQRGMYTEDDPSDAQDLYGRTKFLGEVAEPGCLTLRTSIIGRELRTSESLIDWFLSNRGQRVKGFARAIYSGFTTISLGNIIAGVVESCPELSGVYHVSSNPISKYDLLCLANEVFGAGVAIERDNAFVCDRSLDSTRFRRETELQLPSWETMIEEMAADETPYDAWHERARLDTEEA